MTNIKKMAIVNRKKTQEAYACSEMTWGRLLFLAIAASCFYFDLDPMTRKPKPVCVN